MSTLAKMLAAKQPLFDHSLHQLELRTGKRGVDAKLTAEIANTVAAKTAELGLPLECRGQDLYRALIAKVQQQDEHLARAIGGTDPTSVTEMIPLIFKSVGGVDMPRDGFFIRPEAAEAMLAKTPPPAIMKRLGYDDVNKMLDNENLFELYLALRFAESPEWLNQFDELYKGLKPTDFQERSIQLVRFDPEKWGDIAVEFIKQKLHNITNNKEIGAIAIMPLQQTHMPGVTLKIYPLILHYYNEIRLYSTFFKLMQNKKNFGQIVASTLIADPSHVKIGGAHIHWRVIQRYFGKHPKGHPEIFEPHLQPEDLHWRKAEEVLYDIDPELGFWRDLDYVAALKGDDVIALALMDVSLSYSNGLSYADRYLYHFRESLWNEVFASYFGQSILEEQLLEKLDNDLIKPEELKL